MKPTHSKIEAIRQSPMNPKQWCCQLDCGHDQWITAKARPTRMTLKCGRCAENLKQQARGVRRGRV